jgi:hypothetical protein
VRCALLVRSVAHAGYFVRIIQKGKDFCIHSLWM